MITLANLISLGSYRMCTNTRTLHPELSLYIYKHYWFILDSSLLSRSICYRKRNKKAETAEVKEIREFDKEKTKT